MSWSSSQKHRARQIISAQITRRTMRAKTNRSMAAVVLLFSLIAISGFWMGGQIKAAKDLGSLYVMVDHQGIPIENIPLSSPYPSRTDTTLFIEDCVRLMFDIDSLSFREQMVSYLSQCMTIRDGRTFTEAFSDSGFLELVQQGAVLDIDIRDIELAGQQVVNGVRIARFEVQGVVHLQRQNTLSTSLNMSVIVTRQDLRRYPHGITISQVVWS